MRFMNGDIQTFKETIKGKRLICFGAGYAFRNFMEEYKDYQLEYDIFCLVDNDCKKVGTKVKIRNVELIIQSIRDLLSIQNIVILITCRFIYEVYMQLDAYEELKNVSCWAYSYIWSETNLLQEKLRWYPLDYHITYEQLIPKKIHYCWFGGKPIPQKNLEWMKSWKKYCPDYEIIRWDEDTYDVTKNAYMYEAYQAGKWGFVPDYARLDIIYRYGGIYLDTDVELVRNLDELLYQKAFAGIDSSRNISLGLGFGAQQGCQIMKELRDIYDTKSFLNKDGTYNLTAAPTLQRTFFQEKGYVNHGDYQVIGDLTVYPEKVLSGKCYWTGRILPTEHTFAIHHYDGSWTEAEIKKTVSENQKLFQTICKGEQG